MVVKRKILSLILLAAALARGQSNPEPVLIYGGIVDDLIVHHKKATQDAKRIYIIEGKQKKMIWKGDKIVLRPSVSPNGRFIAFILEDRENGSQTLNRTHSYKLNVLDKRGRVVRSMQDAV